MHRYPFIRSTSSAGPSTAKTLHHKVDYTPYEGREVTGATDTVLSRGKIVIRDGTFVGRAGSGSFIKRSAR